MLGWSQETDHRIPVGSHAKDNKSDNWKNLLKSQNQAMTGRVRKGLVADRPPSVKPQIPTFVVVRVGPSLLPTYPNTSWSCLKQSNGWNLTQPDAMQSHLPPPNSLSLPIYSSRGIFFSQAIESFSAKEIKRPKQTESAFFLLFQVLSLSPSSLFLLLLSLGVFVWRISVPYPLILERHSIDFWYFHSFGWKVFARSNHGLYCFPDFFFLC